MTGTTDTKFWTDYLVRLSEKKREEEGASVGAQIVAAMAASDAEGAAQICVGGDR